MTSTTPMRQKEDDEDINLSEAHDRRRTTLRYFDCGLDTLALSCRIIYFFELMPSKIVHSECSDE